LRPGPGVAVRCGKERRVEQRAGFFARYLAPCTVDARIDQRAIVRS
jgi:hypothetical protein